MPWKPKLSLWKKELEKMAINTINNALPLEATHGKGTVAYFQICIN